MALEKVIEDGAVTITPDGTVNIRRDTVIYDDGVEISRVPHRKVLEAADDIETESDFVKAVAAVGRTPANIAKAAERRALEAASIAEIEASAPGKGNGAGE